MSISELVPNEPEVIEPEAPTTEEPVSEPEPSNEPSNPTEPVAVVSKPEPVSSDPFLDLLLDKIAPVGQQRKNLKVLIYSDPGHGKTVFSGTAPDNLIIDVEDGLISLGNHPDLVKPTVNSVKYKNFAGLEEIIKRFQSDVPQLAHIKTLTIDSLSELHKRGLAEVVEREWKRSPNANNRYVAETEHHTENNEHIRRLVSSLRDLDRNLILLAHSRTLEPKVGPTKTFPDFSEKLANTIAGIVDVVGFMYLKEVEGRVIRVLRLHSNGSVTAKTRIGGFPDEIVDPTWDKLYNTFLKASNHAESTQA